MSKMSTNTKLGPGGSVDSNELPTVTKYLVSGNHSLNMELDLQSLFGRLCTVQLYSLAEIPQLPPSPRIWARIQYQGAIDQPR
jgi:hypothetical protein